MSEQLTIVFFLWRHAEMTPQAFENFYNDDHQELVARTVSPPPRLFERNFREPAATADATATSGIASFDSFTAATFASPADFENWGAILSNPTIAKMLDDNEAEFTEPARRIQLFAEPVRSGAQEPVQADDTTWLLRIGHARSGIDRAGFMAAHEEAIAGSRPIEGALRRVRYYTRPHHALSFVRDAWPQGLDAAPDVIEHLSLRDANAAHDAIDRLRRTSDDPGLLEAESIIPVRQVMRPPTSWRRSLSNV